MAATQKIGYIRVSTFAQNPERQLVGLSLDKTFVEFASGSTTDRPKLQEMIDYIREGDEVFVHEICRLGRNLEDIYSLVRKITEKGCILTFVTENLKFTKERNNLLDEKMLTMLGSFAQFEREKMRERQREGIERAKKAGKYKGRPPTIDQRAICKLLSKGIPFRQVAKLMGVSLSSVQRASRAAAAKSKSA